MKKPAVDFPYQDGSCLTLSDIEIMKISFDPIADTGFWIPPGPDARYTLKRLLSTFEVRIEELILRKSLPGKTVRR